MEVVSGHRLTHQACGVERTLALSLRAVATISAIPSGSASAASPHRTPVAEARQPAVGRTDRSRSGRAQPLIRMPPRDGMRTVPAPRH
jgi:hypothetical protein